MSSKEFTEWVAFYKTFPWDYGTAFLACLISNIMRGKDTKQYSVGDFMPADAQDIDPTADTWENFRNLAAQDESKHGKH